jgi:cytochrome P450
MFAADPAGTTTFRTRALLAAHPEHEARARAEAGAGEPTLPFLRRCVLESLRLWPTTPMILRESRAATAWPSGLMPEDTGILIYAPYFHRDDRHLPFAHRFAPEIWEPGGAAADWPFVPFSLGPVHCPGEDLVLMLTSTMLAALLRGGHYCEPAPAKLDGRRPMPSTLDNYTLRFTIEAPQRRDT